MTIGLEKIKSISRRPFRPPMGWTLISFILTGCSQISPVRYAHFEDVSSDGMPQDWIYEFAPVPADSAEMYTEKFDAIVVVRYTSKCQSKSVVLNIEEFSLSHSRPDTLQLRIPLFSDEGKPLGVGNYGVFETADTIQRGIAIPEEYSISISSPLSQSSTAGINSIGVILSRTGGKTYDLLDLFNKI